ncbi:MAG: pyridoxamine 5-phosphate oxidase-related FMN-binding protein [Acidimicrobiales bacterium]|nr:pyridoxamine 5-phosphate oxidase-related FMN-binding protein [Acidimicrobiales bacterium]
MTQIPIDHVGLEVLDEHACLVLLASQQFGRLGLSVGALPTILPVHFALLGRDPVFRTDAGTKLATASAGNVLCLEVDALDPISHTGWSVVVTGPARVLTEPAELEAARRLPLRPWVGHGDAYVCIKPVLVSGRRLTGRPTHQASAL